MKHRLSAIDGEARTATCAVCGPATRISRKSGASGHGWRCERKHDQHRGRNRGSRRRWPNQAYRHLLGPVCERCGFEPEDPCQLDVHHLDGDHSNHAPANVETVCANCHRLVHQRTRTAR